VTILGASIAWMLAAPIPTLSIQPGTPPPLPAPRVDPVRLYIDCLVKYRGADAAHACHAYRSTATIASQSAGYQR
jgi:hypothetical protein